MARCLWRVHRPRLPPARTYPRYAVLVVSAMSSRSWWVAAEARVQRCCRRHARARMRRALNPRHVADVERHGFASHSHRRTVFRIDSVAVSSEVGCGMLRPHYAVMRPPVQARFSLRRVCPSSSRRRLKFVRHARPCLPAVGNGVRAYGGDS